MSTSLKSKTISGMVWKTISLLGQSGVSFVVSIILARFLLPSDYGVIAMITVFTSVLQIFTDGGLSSALIRKENRTQADLATVFYYNFVLCYLIYGVIFILAPYIAEFYNMPILKDVTRIYTLTMLISPFSSIQIVLLKSAIDFKTQSLIGVGANIISSAIAIYMACTGFGVWSLVIPNLLSFSISTVVYVYIVRWHPVCGFSVQSFKELFGFSSKLLVARLINKAYSNVAPMVVGKFFSPTVLGLYERAKGWPALPSQTLSCMFQSVTFPVLSKMQHDKALLAMNYRRILRMAAFGIFPMMIGLASVAYPLTIVMLTDKWAASAPLMQLICFSFMWFPIDLINLNLLTVTGHSEYFLKLEIVKIILGLLIIVIAMPFGLVTYLIADICYAYIKFFINTHYTEKIINMGFFKQLRDILPILFNCLIMGAISLLIQNLSNNNVVKLLTSIPVSVIYYIISAKVFFPELYTETLNIIRRKQ